MINHEPPDSACCPETSKAIADKTKKSQMHKEPAPNVKVCGHSDDLVAIEGSRYKENEIECFGRDVMIRFTDGTIIRIGYCKPDLGVWYIVVEETGTATQTLTVCEDEDADVYSDVFEIGAEITSHEVVRQNQAKLKRSKEAGRVLEQWRSGEFDRT